MPLLICVCIINFVCLECHVVVLCGKVLNVGRIVVWGTRCYIICLRLLFDTTNYLADNDLDT